MRDAASWIAPIVLLTIFVLVSFWVMRQCSSDPFQPLTLIELRVEPEVVNDRNPTIFNGVCVEGETAQLVQVFLGIEPINNDPIVEGEVFPLIGTADTPEGRERRTLDPGCVATEPLPFEIPTYIEPGMYRLYVHLVAISETGDVQDISERSNTFEVVAEDD